MFPPPEPQDQPDPRPTRTRALCAFSHFYLCCLFLWSGPVQSHLFPDAILPRCRHRHLSVYLLCFHLTCSSALCVFTPCLVLLPFLLRLFKHLSVRTIWLSARLKRIWLYFFFNLLSFFYEVLAFTVRSPGKMKFKIIDLLSSCL